MSWTVWGRFLHVWQEVVLSTFSPGLSQGTCTQLQAFCGEIFMQVKDGSMGVEVSRAEGLAFCFWIFALALVVQEGCFKLYLFCLLFLFIYKYC